MKTTAPATSLASNVLVVVTPSGMMAVRAHGPLGRRTSRKAIAASVSVFECVARSWSIGRLRLKPPFEGIAPPLRSG